MCLNLRNHFSTHLIWHLQQRSQMRITHPHRFILFICFFFFFFKHRHRLQLTARTFHICSQFSEDMTKCLIIPLPVSSLQSGYVCIRFLMWTHSERTINSLFALGNRFLLACWNFSNYVRSSSVNSFFFLFSRLWDGFCTGQFLGNLYAFWWRGRYFSETGLIVEIFRGPIRCSHSLHCIESG